MRSRKEDFQTVFKSYSDLLAFLLVEIIYVYLIIYTVALHYLNNLY